MSRTINSHITNAANDKLRIDVLDPLGAGGANHHYAVSGFTKDHPSLFGPSVGDDVHITFQEGPIEEAGVNGLTHEVLLAILIDRLEHFQVGPYACEENQHALDNLRRGLEWMRYRTQKRVERGVEGTHTV